MDQDNFEHGPNVVGVLPSYDDEHGGVIVEMEESMDPNDFSVILRASLSRWKLQVRERKKDRNYSLPLSFIWHKKGKSEIKKLMDLNQMFFRLKLE